MASEIEKIRDTMWRGPQSSPARAAAFLLTLAVVTADKVLGASWWSVLVSIAVVAFACAIFPTKSLSSDRYRAISAPLRGLREASLSARLICSVAMIAAAFALNYYLDQASVGRAFNLFLVAIFFSALLFGMPVAILTWLVSFVVVYLTVISPRYSFELYSLNDFASLVGYFYLGLLCLAVPVLIRSSSNMGDGA